METPRTQPREPTPARASMDTYSSADSGNRWEVRPHSPHLTGAAGSSSIHGDYEIPGQFQGGYGSYGFPEQTQGSHGSYGIPEQTQGSYGDYEIPQQTQSGHEIPQQTQSGHDDTDASRFVYDFFS